MLKIAYKNLGCKVNAYETNKVRAELSVFNFEEVDFNSYADIYVINTCSVTHVADRKSRQMINRSIDYNENAIVIAMGCSVENIDNSSINNNDNIIFITNKDKDNVKEILKTYLDHHHIDYQIENNIQKSKVLGNKSKNKLVRAFIKIEDGCNQFCSYCIIPYLRGRVKSKTKESIINYIKDRVNNGIVEVVLTGINISSYGLDFHGLNYENEGAIDTASTEFISLINDIAKIEGIKRIRLGSIEPRLINDYFLDSLSKIKYKFCDEFHLSLQSGCDRILKLMNRHYNTCEYYDRCDKIRKVFPNASITTDIIVGFPCETDEDFLETIEFCKKVRFYNPHIFKYSKREGTKAYDMPNQVPEDIKNYRSEKLISITKDISDEIRKSYIDKEVDILVESIDKVDNQIVLNGFTREYIDTKVSLSNISEQSDLLGKIIKVKVKSQKDDFLCAEMEGK